MNTRWISSLVFSSVLLAFGCEQEPKPKASTNQTSASSKKVTTPETSSQPPDQTSTRPEVHEPLTKRGILEEKLSEMKDVKARQELLEGHEWVKSYTTNEHSTDVELHDGSQIDIVHGSGLVPHL